MRYTTKLGSEIETEIAPEVRVLLQLGRICEAGIILPTNS